MVRSSRFAFQLNDGEQLYARSLLGEALVDGVRERLRFVQVGVRGLEPDQVRVRRVRQPARDGLLQARFDAVEALVRALAEQELVVVRIDVAGQRARAAGVGARHQNGVDTQHVGRQARAHQLGNELLRRHDDLAAQVAALLDRRQLVFEMDTGRTGANHVLHDLVGVQHAAEARFRVGDDGGQPVGAVAVLLALFVVMNLIRAQERVVDALHQLGDAVARIQREVRVHRGGGVGVGGRLPAADVDRLQSGTNVLDGLVAGDRTQRVDVVRRVQEVPQAPRAQLGQRVFNLKRAAQAIHVLRAVRAFDALPARRGPPRGGRLVDERAPGHWVSSLVGAVHVGSGFSVCVSPGSRMRTTA